MKIVKILALTVAVLIATMAVGQSKNNKVTRKKAVCQLNNDVKDLFAEMPFEEIMHGTKKCELSLCFRVNDDGTVHFYHVLGKNYELVEYSKELLSNSDLYLEKYLFNEDIYWIKVKFKYVY